MRPKPNKGKKGANSFFNKILKQNRKKDDPQPDTVSATKSKERAKAYNVTPIKTDGAPA